jgi:hypothetical protein
LGGCGYRRAVCGGLHSPPLVTQVPHVNAQPRGQHEHGERNRSQNENLPGLAAPP